MKAQVLVNTECEVDIDPIEVLAQIPDLEFDSENYYSVMAMISRCLSGLKSVPDGMLIQIPEKIRVQISTRLQVEVKRYEVDSNSARNT